VNTDRGCFVIDSEFGLLQSQIVDDALKTRRSLGELFECDGRDTLNMFESFLHTLKIEPRLTMRDGKSLEVMANVRTCDACSKRYAIASNCSSCVDISKIQFLKL
jgi:hypothetical protein